MNNVQIRVYTTNICPKCKQLKGVLDSGKLSYEEIDMSTAEALTELRINGIFTASAPVLQVNDKFLTTDELFDENGIKKSSIQEFISIKS